jgi:hypothetical protein
MAKNKPSFKDKYQLVIRFEDGTISRIGSPFDTPEEACRTAREINAENRTKGAGGTYIGYYMVDWLHHDPRGAMVPLD